MRLFRHKGKLWGKEDLRNLKHLRAIEYRRLSPGRKGGRVIGLPGAGSAAVLKKDYPTSWVSGVERGRRG